MQKVLVVDDDPGVRELLTDFLASRGYAVETAADGALGLEAVARSAPDLVLLDLMMPGMNGMEVLQRLRAGAGSSAVVVITAVSDEAIGRSALQRGAIDYLTKPIDLAYLERVVSAALLGAEAQR